MKAYLWSTNDGNASWTVNRHQGHWQGTKPASSKFVNCSSYYFYILVKMFIPLQPIHGCRYCSINNTNELSLLMSMCFWLKKGINGRANQFEKQ